MSSPWRPRLAVAAVALVLGAGPMTPARGANPCDHGGSSTPLPADSGIGGTGRTPAEGGIEGTGRDPGTSGIGGTGRSSAKPATTVASGEGGIHGTGRSDDNGIGGTGRSGDNGIGGTGLGPDAPGGDGIAGTGYARLIIGTVTGYASLCVSGIEVGMGSARFFTDDDGDSSAIPAIGETVEILADGEGDRVRAVSVTRAAAVTGPLESIDVDSRTMRVLGQRVRYQGATRSRNSDGRDQDLDGRELSVGGFVRVSGLRDQDGVIVADRVDPDRNDRIAITAVVTSVDGLVVQLGSVAVDLSRVTQLPPKQGDTVVVSGRLEKGRVVADRLRRPLAPISAGDVRRIDVDGYLSSNGRTLSFGGLRVAVPRETSAASGSRVNASVSVSASGKLTVESLRPAIEPRGLETGAGGGAQGKGGAGAVRRDDDKKQGLPPPDEARRNDHPDDQPLGGHRSDRGEPPPTPDRPEPPDRPERPDFPDRPPPRPGDGTSPPPPPPPPPPPSMEAPRLESIERPAATTDVVAPERVERPERATRPDRVERLDRGNDGPERVERLDRIDRVERPAAPPERVEVPRLR